MEIPKFISPDLEAELYEPVFRRVFVYTKNIFDYTKDNITMRYRLGINCESPCDHEPAKFDILLIPEYDCLNDDAKASVRDCFDEHPDESSYGVYEVVNSYSAFWLDTIGEYGTTPDTFAKSLEFVVDKLKRYAKTDQGQLCDPIWMRVAKRVG